MDKEELDIFSIGDPQAVGKFFSFKEVGDSVKGTYIDVREGVDTFNNDQYIYVLKDKEGEIHNIGVRKSNEILVEEMNAKKFGDIIGLKYDEDKESKRYPGKFAKIIRVYPFREQGPVDEAWLAERAVIDEKLGRVSPASVKNVVEPVGEVAPVSDGVATAVTTDKKEDSEAAEAVRNLARAKGLATAEMTNEEADAAVLAFTGLPLTDENLGQAIVKISNYSK